MSTFIEEHGNIRYAVGWSSKKYKVTGPCEVRGCTEYQARKTEAYRKAQEYRITENLEEFSETYEMFLRPVSPYLRLSNTYYEKDMLLRKSERRPKSNPFVLDHCHDHGWIRGVVCRSCNSSPLLCGSVNDAAHRVRERISGEPDYWSHLMNCPECEIDESEIRTGKRKNQSDIDPTAHNRQRLSWLYPSEWFNYRWEVYHGFNATTDAWARTPEAAAEKMRKLKVKHPQTTYAIRKMRQLKPQVSGKRENPWIITYEYSESGHIVPQHIKPNADLPHDDGLLYLIDIAERELYIEKIKKERVA